METEIWDTVRTYMIELGEVVRLLLHAAGPSCALRPEFVDNVDKVDNLDDDLPASRNVVSKANLALAASPKDDVCDLELILELLHARPVSRSAQSHEC